MESFTLKNVSFTYPNQTKKALNDITLSVEKGDFFVLCGPSGGGKSTLLRQLKTVLTPGGQKKGEILFEGQPLSQINTRTQAACIGYVLQSPEHQIVTDTVWQELAFGLENLGFDTQTIRRRVAEMASFFGIEPWFHRSIDELSGGQKQLLNLAGIMAMQPSVIILDEPTSQLDPIAAGDFLAALYKINRELGITILLTEHRLEEAFAFATKAAVLENGRLLCTGTPKEVGLYLKKKQHSMFAAMPTPMRVWAAVNTDLPCPVTVREGNIFLSNFAQKTPLQAIPDTHSPKLKEEIVLTASNVWFRYEQTQPDIIKGLQLSVSKGEILTVLGGNGSGKTTALKLLAGLQKPQRGSISAKTSIGVLPQNPQTLFLKKNLQADLQDVLDSSSFTAVEKEQAVNRMAALCHISDLLSRHPYDLSGGEQQRAALAKVLLTHPGILLMDEPTKGFDAAFKKEFAAILHQLSDAGVSIVMVSHDIEFCALYAHRCALFFDGAIVTQDTPGNFFAGNSFYTTSANRMARHLLPTAITPQDVILACNGSVEETPPSPINMPVYSPKANKEKKHSPSQKQPLALPRKIAAGFLSIIAVFVFGYITRIIDIVPLIGAENAALLRRHSLWITGLLILLLMAIVLLLSRRTKPPAVAAKVKTRLPRRTLAAAIMILLCIPLTLWAGVTYAPRKSYYIIALLIVLECMLPFFLVFEGRRPKAKELVIIAVLCALGVAGRVAFFMLPQFKPVMAITILAGVAFGGETGFLVGSVTMLASNALFSQGPWTPFQMFCMGIVGFLAGIVFRSGLLPCRRWPLALFGGLAAIFLYGGIINPASALLAGVPLTLNTLLAFYASGFPGDCIHGLATMLFLLAAGEPMLEKLYRIRQKYDLME